MDINALGQFDPRTSEKVERLLDVLSEMTKHPLLRGRFAMYGGTAINLFMVNIPRLSVDIDATLVGCAERDQMLAVKPEIERAIGEVARSLGFTLSMGREEHAGRTFFLGYRDADGPDNVKIDFTYLNRVPLLPIESRTTAMRDGLSVPLLAEAELIGGKAKAYFSRVKVRDIYDIANLLDVLENVDSEQQRLSLHKVMLYKASLSAAFPFGFQGREQRFANRQMELETELYPMLRSSNERPTLEELMSKAKAFTDAWVQPQNGDDETYLERLAAGKFVPELLFSDPVLASRAMESPEAAWKLKNLHNMNA